MSIFHVKRRNPVGVTVLAGSQNPVKIDAVREAFSLYYEKVKVTPVSVDSGVGIQPVGADTFIGAENRANALLQKNKAEKLGADFFAGIEGGIINLHGRWFSFGGVCIMDLSGRKGFGSSSMFELPGSIVRELLAGTELGDVMDKIQNGHNTKQKHGAVGFFTKGRIDRKKFYESGIISALIPFVNRKLFDELI
ncbi:MAG: inosine/xanthosine triphosphatase [Elusimicrobia bacterium HGW-Elusimicrobia-2]|nr:MAG: inosine/xanthosine triphosphatase [Elusimicrobia bacterium HGW-Elusimicrobia-2]